MESDPLDNKPARNTRWLLGGIVLLAISIRAWGIDFGLPYLYHPDEPVPVGIAQTMFKTGDLNPHFFHWPSMIFYLNAAAYIPYYFAGKLMGVFSSPSDILGPIWLVMGVGLSPMPTTWLLGRCLTAAFGSASVILVFLIGRNLADDAKVGWLAALLMAVSPTNVGNSRFITPDTFATFFTLLSFLAAVQVFRQGALWHYVLAGVGIGLAASSKYNGALVGLGLVLAHFLRFGARGIREPRLYIAVSLGIVAFLVTTPFAWLDYPKFHTDLQFDLEHYSTGHAGMEGNTVQWYLTYLWGAEGPVVLLAVLEILRGLYMRSKHVILLAVFPVVYFVFISRLVVRNDRTVLLLTPFLFLLAASLLVWLFRRIKERRSGQLLMLSLVGGVAIVSLALPILQTVQSAIQLTTVDSRETARVWIDRNLPAGSKIAVEAYAPFIDPQRFSVHGFDRMIDHPPAWYVTNGFEYLIFGEYMYGRFYHEPDRYASEVSQYEALFDTFGTVKIFTDGGYEVRICCVVCEEANQ